MKVLVRALFPVSQMDDGERISKGTHCNNAYLKNGHLFTATPPSTLEQRTASVERLAGAVAAAVDGGRTASNELAAAREEFNTLFGDYRDWANQRSVALGNAIKVNQLGMEASKPEAHRAAKPAAPVMKEVSVVGPGCVRAACETVTGTRMYSYFVAYGATEPDLSEFRFVLNCTTATCNLPVTSGLRPWVRMLATNTAGMSEYSAAMALPVV